MIVPTDNSPAQWAFTLACIGECPQIECLRNWFAVPSESPERILIAFTLSNEERKQSTYKLTLQREFNVNRQGWKLGHIKEIGLKKQRDLGSMDIKNLKKHHLDFLRPANMFVVPKQWAGLAEIREVAAAMINRD